MRVHGHHAERVPGAVDRRRASRELAGGCHRPRRIGRRDRRYSPGVPRATARRLAVACTLVVACSSASDAVATASTGDLGPQATTPLRWERCGDDFECASLRVPVDDAGRRWRHGSDRRHSAPGGGSRPGRDRYARRELRGTRRSRHQHAARHGRRPPAGRPPAVRPRRASIPAGAALTPDRLRRRRDLRAGVVRGPHARHRRGAAAVLRRARSPSISSPTASSASARGSRRSAPGTSPVISIVSAAALSDARLDVPRLLLRHASSARSTHRSSPIASARWCSTRAVDLSSSMAAQQRGNAAGFERALEEFLADCRDRRAVPSRRPTIPPPRSRACVGSSNPGLGIETPGGRSIGVTELYFALLAALYTPDAWPFLAAGAPERRGRSRGQRSRGARATSTPVAARTARTRTSRRCSASSCATTGPSRVDVVRVLRATYESFVRDYPFFGPVIRGAPLGCDPRMPASARRRELGDVRTTEAPPDPRHRDDRTIPQRRTGARRTSGAASRARGC